MDRLTAFRTRGWTVFKPATALEKWAEHARGAALRALRDPGLDHWYRCNRTWFVGVDALDCDAEGRLAGGPPLEGAVVDFLKTHATWPGLHRAQLSGVFPGYPEPCDGESAAAFRYRRDRDAAHVDGVLGEGAPKRRFVREPHAFVLGLPITRADETAAPLVAWEGSHHVMRRALADAFAAKPHREPECIDVTDAYVAARRQVFATCARRTLTAPPGGAILLHRLCLHGIAPFAPNAVAAPEGRLIAYFRPAMEGGASAWVTAD